MAELKPFARILEPDEITQALKRADLAKRLKQVFVDRYNRTLRRSGGYFKL